MTEDNPYTPPQATLEKKTDNDPLAVTGPHAVLTGRGGSWLFEGFDYFKSNPLGWIGAMALIFIIAIALAVLPFGSLAHSLLNPVFTAGLMIGCYRYDQGERFEFTCLFDGFSRNVEQLLLIFVFSMLYGIVMLIALMIIFAIGALLISFSGLDFSALAGGIDALDPDQLLSEGVWIVPVILFGVLLMMLAFLPLILAVLFAPPLVALSGLDAYPAMVLSYKGCMKNLLPLTLYGLVVMVMMMIAMIPLGLGLLVVMPMMTASTYIAYREIFTRGSSDRRA